MDVCTSHNRETWLFWLLSRPIKLVARVGEGAQDHSDGWIKGRISPSDTMAASKPKIGRRYEPQQRASPFWFLSPTSKVVAWVGGGTLDHSKEWAKGRISPSDTMAASKPKIRYRYQPQQRASPFWFLSPTSKVAAWVGGGTQDHNNEWVIGRI